MQANKLRLAGPSSDIEAKAQIGQKTLLQHFSSKSKPGKGNQLGKRRYNEIQASLG